MSGLMGGGVGSEQQRQQQQYMNMRGAQIAEQNAEQKTELGSQPKAQGSKKQLIGTITGVAAVFVLLIILKALNVI